MKKTFDFLILSILTALPLWAYTNAEVDQEQVQFLNQQLDLHDSMLASAAALAVPDDLFFFKKAGAFAFQSSLGQVIAPLFMTSSASSYKLFSNSQISLKYDYEEIFLDRFSLLLGILPGLTFGLNGSYLPSLSIKNQNQAFTSAGAVIYGNHFNSTISSVGLSSMAGYEISFMKTSRNLDLSYTDSQGTAVLNGTLTNSAAMQSAFLGIKLNKTLYIINFFGVLMGTVQWGDRTAGLSGSFPKEIARNSLSYACLLQGGLEIDLGNIKFNAGGGKNLLADTYSGHFGMKIEF